MKRDPAIFLGLWLMLCALVTAIGLWFAAG
jgi:hypothetical protein